MADNERIEELLNTYRARDHGQESKVILDLATEPHGHAGGCREPFPAGGSVSDGGQEGERRQDMGRG